MTTFDNLRVQEYEFEIEGPDGQIFEVTMRTPTPEEVIEASRAFPRPQAPVSDLKREGDRFFNIYNFQDGTYLANMETWFANTRKWLIARVLIEPPIPGETLEDKAKALDDIAAWAMAGLRRAMDMLSGGAEENVTMRKFQPPGMDVGTDS